MEFVRTVLLIVALVLGWGAVRADPAMVFGLLGCAMPAVGRWGARLVHPMSPSRRLATPVC